MVYCYFIIQYSLLNFNRVIKVLIFFIGINMYQTKISPSVKITRQSVLSSRMAMSGSGWTHSLSDRGLSILLKLLIFFLRQIYFSNNNNNPESPVSGHGARHLAFRNELDSLEGTNSTFDWCLSIDMKSKI